MTNDELRQKESAETSDASNEDYTERTEKRAQWETFEFSVPCPGKVNIQNVSYGEEEARNHIYTVTVEKRTGEVTAVGCTCPANEHHEGPCKHRVATENAPLVLFTAAPRVATDGGHATVSDVDGGGVPEPEISGPHAEFDTYGRATGATYWRCEDCQFEALLRSDVEQFCDCRLDGGEVAR